MKTKPLKFAPRELFEKILEYSVIPTFDLVVEMPEGGVLVFYRTIKPYQNQWALPGLRMMKPESIEDTLQRIAWKEAGLKIDVKSRKFLGQFVGRFRTESNRQDISTGYAVRAIGKAFKRNEEHFSAERIIQSVDAIPDKTGAMYRFYLKQYFAMSS